jgi:Flp pilus assembly protein CpaB
MTYRLRNIGIAVALAIVAALLTTFYVTNYKRTVQQGEETVSVYVAAKDIALGTSGADVSQRDLMRVEHVSRRSVVPGAISKPDQIGDLVAVEPIYAGEQISTRRFRTGEEQGIRAQLKGNLRAFQLAGNDHQLLSGTLVDGDRVDFVGTIVYGRQVEDAATRVVLRNLLVLQATEATRVGSKLGSDPNSPFSLMLALTDAQSQKLFHIVEHGKWSLELRPVTDAADSPESVETSRTVIVDGLSAGQLRRLRGGR